MTNSEVIEKINGFLAEEFETEQDKITPGAPLKETLDLDSLDYVDLVVIIEGNFGIKVRQEDFVNIHTFSDLYQYVTDRLRQAHIS